MERREYVIAHEAYYYDRLQDVIREPAVYLLGDGREIWVTWRTLSNGLSPRIEVFDDAWSLFATWADFWVALKTLETPPNSASVTIRQFCDLLNAHGFTDVTEREQPPERCEDAPERGAGGSA